MKVTEYTILFKEGTELYDQYDGEYTTEDIDYANEIFNQYKADVDQYYSKRWIVNKTTLEWTEDFVEVFYDGE